MGSWTDDFIAQSRCSSPLSNDSCGWARGVGWEGFGRALISSVGWRDPLESPSEVAGRAVRCREAQSGRAGFTPLVSRQACCRGMRLGLPPHARCCAVLCPACVGTKVGYTAPLLLGLLTVAQLPWASEAREGSRGEGLRSGEGDGTSQNERGGREVVGEAGYVS